MLKVVLGAKFHAQRVEPGNVQGGGTSELPVWSEEQQVGGAGVGGGGANDGQGTRVNLSSEAQGS